jgi:hypothetical protein
LASERASPTGSVETTTVDRVIGAGQHEHMNEHEQGFLEFLAEPSRRRMKTLLELGERRRRDVLSQLHHAVRLDPRYSQHLTGSDAFSAPVEAKLQKLGAPATCYVIGANTDLDAREVPLREALNAIIGMGNGAFVSCVPGRLGFYEFEDIKSSYLLAR